MRRDLQVLKNRIQYLTEKNHAVKEKIQKAKNPGAIEKEARDRLDFADENDLIFIFPKDI